MSRSFAANQIVTLPRLSALSTARLLQELVTALEAEPPPPIFASDAAELSAAHAALNAELTRKLTGPSEDSAKVRAADHAEDGAFAALFFWLTGWARLPQAKHPEAARAAAVLAAVFPAGRAFLTLRAADEWQEAELRLRLLADKGHDATIAQLGGQAFLDELAAAHAAYGEALGITRVPSAPEPPAPALRAALDAALDVVRGYVMRVSGHVRAKDPATGAVADRLLAPLVRWRDAAKAPASAATEPAGAATEPASAAAVPAGDPS